MSEWSSNLVSAIIVSCQRYDLLIGLLECLKRQSYQPIEKIVVLNRASEDEVVKLRRSFPEAAFLANRENLLFCRAHNQGISAAHGEFVLCLNDDLVLEEDFVVEMVKAAKIDERIGMVSGCIIRQDKKTLDSTGLVLARSRKPQERGYGRKRDGRYQTGEYIFGAGGVAPLYRRKMLEDIKIGNEYFDEDYGIFYEDLDVSWRAQNRSWKGYYTPFALAYHQRGATVKQIKPKLAILQNYNFTCLRDELKLRLVKNRYMTIIKNDRPGPLLLNLPWFLGYEIRLWVYLMLFEPGVAWRIFQDLGFLKRAWRKRRPMKPHFA